MLDFLLGLGLEILKGGFQAAGIAEKWRRRKELDEYLKAIIASYEHKTTRPISPLYQRFDLPQRYVVPTLAPTREARKAARDYLLERCDSEDDFRLLIHGIFGSGKTALCLDLSYHLAKHALTAKGRPRVPLYVSLRGLTSQSQSGLEELLVQHLSDYRLTTYKTFSNFLREEDVVLLLDGFDQMDTSGQEFARAHLLGVIHLCLESSDAKVVLTMRSGYFERSPVLLQGLNGELRTHPESDAVLNVRPFEMIHLGGLDDAQILEYLKKHPRTRSMNAQLLLEKLCASVHLAEVARHPLLLNMILEVGDEVLSGSQIVDLGQLYKVYTDYWLKHDSYLEAFSSPGERRRFVEDLAFATVEAGAETGVFLDEIKGLDGNSDWRFARTMFTAQGRRYSRRTRSFLLANHDGSLLFAHRSIGEYFCALATLRLLRQPILVPKQMLPRLYSNLIVWFMRCAVTDGDYDWIAPMAGEDDVYRRCLAYALLPAVSGERKQEVLELLEERFGVEPDMDAKRHILYGIGWLGKNPCTPEFLGFIREHKEEWIRACAPYYHSTQRQREHCVRRLIAFRSGDVEFHGSRGLYILDLGEVGRPEDIELIEPYVDPLKEADSAVREIASEAISRIAQRGLEGQQPD